MAQTIKNKSKKRKLTEKNKIVFYNLPKGTLLFRTVLNPKTDYAGMYYNNKYCLSKNHNVFFYPYPFVADAIQAVNPYKYYSEHDRIEIYETKNDLKLLSLIKPSKLTRGDRLGNSILTTCDKVDSYKCEKGHSYDPCLSSSFQTKYPEIVGYIAIGRQDGLWIQEAIQKNKIPKKESDFIHFSYDRLNKGVPEIVLYPLNKRIEHIGKYESFMKKYSNLLNYKHIASLSRKDHNKEIHNFLESNCLFDNEKKLWKLKE